MTGPTQNSASRPASLLLVALVIAGLYFAREFLLPLALAALISFLLAPLIRGLERWGMGRIGSVLAATAVAFSIIGALGYLVAGQLIDLANRVPEYEANLGAKIASLKTRPNSPFSRATRTLRQLGAKLDQPEEAASAAPAAPPLAAAGNPAPAPPPLPVTVIEAPGSTVTWVQSVLVPMLGPLGTAAIVIVFVIFMLVEREDLRDRVIHLIGRGRLQLTTQALDDAANRVSRYLLAQCIVNVSYGIPIGLGLWWIGIPNAFLWGFLATILRFVPYIGPWIAAAIPLALSLAVTPSWTAPLLTIGLFVVIELISNNVVEPWLYGSSTGLSPMAVIVSAVFWTWLWGTPGLLLATPLTVCIAVLGKYLPSLSYLDVLLGDKPPIAPEDRFYQRLLAMDGEETLDRAEEYVETKGLIATFDELILPTVRLVEADFHAGTIDEGRRHEMYGALRELIAELGEEPSVKAAEACVLCLPASNEADELAALMLARALGETGVSAGVLSSKLMTGELLEQTVAAAPKLVCISSVPPGSVVSATHLCKRLREQLGGVIVAVGVWGASESETDRRLQRLQRARADHTFTSLTQAVAEIRAQPVCAVAAPPPKEKAA